MTIAGCGGVGARERTTMTGVAAAWKARRSINHGKLFSSAVKDNAEGVLRRSDATYG